MAFLAECLLVEKAQEVFVRLPKIEALLKANSTRCIVVTACPGNPRYWLCKLCTWNKGEYHGALAGGPAASCASAFLVFEHELAGLSAETDVQVRGDSVLLRTLHAAEVELELRWDSAVEAFRATARLFPEEATGPVRREGCIRWCFDSSPLRAVLRVAAHLAKQLVLDHESFTRCGD